MRQVVIIALGFVVVAYQNFTYVDWDSVKLTPINESSRKKHAREVLGNQYEKISSLKNMYSKSKLNRRMHILIKENLAEKNMSASLEISQAVITESQKYKMDPLFVLAVIETESKFDPEALGSFGEIGLMQIKPDTAEWIVEKQGIKLPKNWSLKDPATNIKIGTAYFAYLRESFKKMPLRYIAAYNMGPSNLRKLNSQNKMPKQYSSRVFENYLSIYQQVNDRLAQQDI